MTDKVKDVEIELETIRNPFPSSSLIPSCSHHVDKENNTTKDAVSSMSSSKAIPGRKTPCQPFFGISFTILSAFAVVLANLFAKLCKQLPVLEIAVIRFMVQLAITIPFLVYANEKIVYSKKIMFLLILRGFSGTSGMLSRLYAVQNMPLGDATVLSFTTPVFAALFGRIILKEPFHRIYIFLLLLCLAGVTLIARPTFIFGHPDTTPEYDNIWLPSLSAVNCAVLTGFNLVLVRILKRYSITSSVIIFHLGWVGLVFSICGSYLDRGFQFPFCQSIDYLYAFLVGIGGYVIQATITAALKFEKAFVVSLVRTSGIVFGFAVQVLVYSLPPSDLSIGGAALITLSNMIIFLYNWRKSKQNSQLVLNQSFMKINLTKTSNANKV